MFSGIINHQGLIKKIEKSFSGQLIVIKTNLFSLGKVADSVAVNGVCLTISRISNQELFFDVWRESLLKTTLGNLNINDKVHLELALKYGQYIGGHPISGHVDYVGKVEEITTVKNSEQVKIWFTSTSLFDTLLPLRGSVSISGVSLTITDKRVKAFSISLIPETLKGTLLDKLMIGSEVNIETDFMARNQINNNSLLSYDLPNELYLGQKAENNIRSIKIFFKSGLPIILKEKEKYYFVCSILKIQPKVLMFILAIARSHCLIACSSFIADKFSISSPKTNSRNKNYHQFLPISHCDNKPFDFSAKAIIKSIQLFKRSSLDVVNWQALGTIYGIRAKSENCTYPLTIFESAVRLALIVDKEEAAICCQIYDNLGNEVSEQDINELALRYNLPICNVEEIF